MSKEEIVATVSVPEVSVMTPEASELDRQATLIEQKCEQVAVTSDAQYAFAGELAKQVKSMQNTVKEYWEPMRKSTYAAYKAVTDHKKQMLDPLESAEKILKRKMLDYANEQDRKRKEEEEMLRKAAQQEVERKLQEAADAESAGNADAAAYAMSEAEVYDSMTFTSHTTPAAPTAKGISSKKQWVIKSIDPAQVPISIMGVELRPVDEKAVLALAKATNGAIQIPGIELAEVYTSIGVRTK